MIEHAKTRYQDEFYFYSGDMFIGQSIKLYGEYTQVEIECMEPYLKDAVVYDIGGNIGYHATAFASMAKEVHSFEPNKKNFNLLEMNTKNNENVYLYQCAISAVDGYLKISDYDEEGHGNFGQCEIGDEGQLTQSFAIDNLNLPDPDLIKIDVEGHELAVFAGAQNTIIRSKPVIFFESMHVEGLHNIFNFLNRNGYKVYWMHAYNFNTRNLNGMQENIFMNSGVINCIAVPIGKVQPFHLSPVMTETETSADYIARMEAAGKLKIL